MNDAATKEVEENENYSNYFDDKNQLFQWDSSEVDVPVYPLPQIERHYHDTNDGHNLSSLEKVVTPFNKNNICGGLVGEEYDEVIHNDFLNDIYPLKRDENGCTISSESDYKPTAAEAKKRQRNGLKRFFAEDEPYIPPPTKEAQLYREEECQNVSSGCESLGLHHKEEYNYKGTETKFHIL